MTIEHFLQQLEQQPDSIEFEQTIALIDRHFHYQPTAFRNGPELRNAAGSNEGSCKIFAFARLMSLSPASTLACFGRFYREEVLLQPDAQNHGNIRTFMRLGWDGIEFEGEALSSK